MAVTIAIIAEHIEHDIVDAAVQRLIDDADALIVERFGSDSTRTEYFELKVPKSRLWLSSPATSLTTVKEGTLINDLTTLVEGTDHQLTENGWVVERLGGWFLPRVEVVFAPISDSTKRDRVTIDLVRLAIQYSALNSLKDGDHSESGLDYDGEREKLIMGLNQSKRMLA